MSEALPTAENVELITSAEALAKEFSSLEKIIRASADKALNKAPQRSVYDSDDVVQDTCIAALLSPKIFSGPKKFRDWMSLISWRRALQMLRDPHLSSTAGNERLLKKIIDRQDHESAAEERDLLDRFRHCIETLQEPYRVTILLLLEGKTYDEMVSLLGVPMGVVTARIINAKKLLRTRMGAIE